MVVAADCVVVVDRADPLCDDEQPATTTSAITSVDTSGTVETPNEHADRSLTRSTPTGSAS